MTAQRLQQIKTTVADESAFADSILDGGENYDGADGARAVSDLCGKMEELIEALEQATTTTTTPAAKAEETTNQ